MKLIFRFFFVICLFSVILLISTNFTIVQEKMLSRQTDNSEEKFMHNGRTVDEMTGVVREGRRKKYAEAESKFREFSDCVTGFDDNLRRKNSYYEISKEISSLEEFEVCIFRASSFFGSADRLSEWLSFIGFRVEVRSKKTDRLLENGETKLIAFWDKHHKKSLFPFNPDISTRITTMFVRSGIRIDVLFLNDRIKFGVDLSFSRGP